MTIELNVLRNRQLDQKSLMRTTIGYRLNEGEDIEIIVFHRRPRVAYRLDDLTGGPFFRRDLECAVDHAARLQRMLIFADSLNLKGCDVRKFAKFRSLELYGTDHLWWLTCGSGYKDVLIFDAPYSNDGPKIKGYDWHGQEVKENWSTLWLPSMGDPYFPGKTYARLSKHETSNVDLNKLYNLARHIDFKIKGTESNYDCYVVM